MRPLAGVIRGILFPRNLSVRPMEYCAVFSIVVPARRRGL